jgi:hypothetical protein
LKRSLAALLGCSIVVGVGAPASAKHFENTYVGFDLPDDWSCKLEAYEWVCKPPPGLNGRVSMMVILTAKIVGKGDSPQLYIRHLEEIGDRDGVIIDSPPVDRLIGQTIWLDASLWNSELPNYKTRYLVRTEGRLGVLVTFSAHRSVPEQARAISDMIAGSVEVNSYVARPELHPK